MAYSWHQIQAIRRNGAPDYAHATYWTVISGKEMMGAIRFETREEAETYLATVKRLHGHDGWIVPPIVGQTPCPAGE